MSLEEMKIRSAYFGSSSEDNSVWNWSFSNPLETHLAWRPDQVLELLRRADLEAQGGNWSVLVVTYEAASAFDPTMRVHKLHEFPLATLAVFERAVELAQPGKQEESFNPSWTPAVSRSEYGAAVQTIQGHITEGDTYQVNYTIPLTTKFSGRPYHWYLQLASAQAARYSCCIDLDRFQILSLSPELFFERQGSTVRTRPMKGTMPRGRWTEEDEHMYARLASSEKDRAENVMIVDLLRNDLGRISLPGSVRVPRLFEVERYPSLFQMTSTVESTLPVGTTLVDIFTALFPCGSITGAPKIRTMDIINSVERQPRGVYTGAIGLVKPGGDCIFNVAIRTAVLDTHTGTATFGVGGGITHRSAAESEYDECLLKASFLNSESGDFRLFESLRLENGAFRLLDRHLDRLLNSARYFDFRADKESIRGELIKVATNHPEGIFKVRLLLDRSGRIVVDEPVPVVEADRVLTVGFSSRQVNTRDRMLYHKSTCHDAYTHEREAHPDWDDVIFWNERGEVTESAIANIVLQQGDELYTPPRNSGLLEGTFRAELLESGKIRERIISKDDLHRAGTFFLINSVRLWMKARLVNA